jgi:hypothetical protein
MMTPAHVFSSARRYAPPQAQSGLRDVATRMFYFTTVVIVFVFVSILITGVHP